MKYCPFAKYVGCGNDFILIDWREHLFPIDHSFIQRLCQRQNGIGADGVILLENPTRMGADYRFRIFNSDGSEAEMCGNGLRCFVKWINDQFCCAVDCVETVSTLLKTKQVGQNICIEMGSPSNIQWNIPFYYDNQSLRVQFINTGVPHAVIFVNDFKEVNILTLCPYIRHHPLWGAQGANVTIAERKQDNYLKIRTYERGVEGETLGCGTGAVAAALSAAHLYQSLSPITVETLSSEELTVDFYYDNQEFSHVTLTGPARCVFTGKIDIYSLSFI